MRRVALLACCAVLCVLIVADQASAQTPPEAPATPTTTPKTNRISVHWSAPAGMGITAYDVRYIRADAPDKADANWTLVDPAWTTGGGALTYRMDDLRDEIRSEIQVRAVNSDGDGAWSMSATRAPNDIGRTGPSSIPTADLRVPRSIKGFLSSPTDADTYRTSEASGTGSTFIYTTGPLHADGDLFSRAGRQLRGAGAPIMSIDGVRGIGLMYRGNTTQYHFEVSSLNDRHSDEYSVHAVAVIDPASSTSPARTIPLGTVTRGRIHPTGGTAGNQDYFKFVLAASTTIWAAAFGDFTSGVEHFDTYMDLLDSAGTNVLATSNDTYLPVGPNSSSIVATLDVGTYYLRIRGDTDSDTGYYTLDFRSAQLPGSTSGGAIPLRLHGLAAGDLSSTTDTDFFRITNYKEEFWQIALVAPTAGITFAATLSTADGTARSIHVSQESPSAGSAATLRATLQPGVYSLQVSSSDSTAPGQYLVLPTYDAGMRATLADCGPGAGSVRTDSLYDCLWHLEDLGLYPNSNNVDINVEGVWATNKGAGIVVAIVDDGVDPTHEDLHENVDDTMTHAYGTADDYSLDATHGTALAGAAVALAQTWTNLPAFRDIEVESATLDAAIAAPARNDLKGPVTEVTLTLDPYVGFVEFMEIDITLEHPSIRDMEIELVSPSGVVSRLSTRLQARHSRVATGFPSAIDGPYRFGSSKHLGENAVGVWKLRISDYLQAHTGTLKSWKLKAYGHGLMPGYATVDSATAGARQLTIGWTAPTDVGGSAVTSYDLRYVRSSAAATATPTVVTAIGTVDTATYNLTGLDPAEYDIQVRAVNTTGAGPWSEGLKGTTTKEKPFAPSIDTVTSRNAELAVAWSAPTVDGGSEITSYGVHHILTSGDGTIDANWTPNDSAWITGGGDLEYTITGLTNAESYDVRVSATNAIGTSEWSTVMTGTPDVLNHDPMFADATAERSVAENTVAGRNIGSRVAATDSDGDTLTYTLTSGAFDINATTGQLLTEAALNYEMTTSYIVIIGVSDGKDSNDEADMVEDDSIIVTVNVTDVDEPPEISGDEMITVAENHDATLDTYRADDPEGATTPTITWALAGADAGDFAITAGALSFDPPPDYDIPADSGTNNIYNVTVQARQGSKTGSLAVTVTVTGVNERPTITSGPVTVGYPENRTNLRVGTYAATDPDAGDTVTWSLEGTDRAAFAITTSGAVTFKDQPNYEAKDEYTITVKATDGGVLSDTRDVVITVEDFDEPPEISGDEMITVAENHDATLDTYRADDPEGDTTTPITWALAGVDAGDFEISDMGALSFDPPPDYDMPADAAPSDNVYLVTVQALQGSKTGSLAVTVTVTPVNEGPTITTGRDAVSYLENRTDKSVDTYAATDPDGDAVTWSLEGTDAGDFEISATGAVTFKDQPNHEAKEAYTITVKAADPEGLSGTRDVTVTVEDFDEPPEISGDKTITVEENHSGTLDTYMATDPEGATTITWSTGGTDGDDFTISATGDLSFKSSPDFEDPLDSSAPYNEYLVTVRASDGAETGMYEVTVTVTPVDEPPEVEGPMTVMDFPENSPETMVVASYTATDPEGSAGLIWSTLSGTDAGKFGLDSDGDLRFKTSPNFELQSKYKVTVNASDGGTELGSLDVTVTLEDVNEPPTISGPVTVDYTENGTGTVATYSAMDPDAGATQTWSPLGADRNAFEISDTGDLRFKSPPDYDMPTDVGGDRGDNVYLVTVQVYDGFNRVTRDVVVRVEDVDEAPTVSGSLTPSVAENSTGTIETYTADDPERGVITWSVEGAGKDDFTISSAGALSFAVASPPNYEAQTSHTVTVRASDEEHDVDTDVTVTVTDVNEVEEITLSARRPLIGADYTAAFTEGKGDAVQSPTWVWARSTSLNSGYVDITAATAATYRPLAADRDYYLRVTASYNDGHGTTTKTLVATSEFVTAPNSLNNMAPVFPSPLFTGGVTGLSVLENATADTVVGVAPEATDDQGSTLSYSLEVSGFTTDPPFEINATTRQIRVASGAILNHEDPDRDSYSVTVKAEDEFNLTATATFEITVGDVNEAPTAVPDTPSTPEGDAVTFDVLTNDTDPDDGDTLTVAIATRPAANLGSVSLDPDTYEVTYTPPDSDFNGPVTFTYTASDGEFDDDASVTITVDPVNDPPTFPAATAARSISERAQPGVLVGAAVTAEDVDGDVLEYSLSLPGASGFFVIDAETGQISVGPTPDFELETYNATVTATDEEGEIATIAVPITVTDVNDAPTAGNDTASVDEDKSVTIDVLANDSDPEGVALRVSVATQPANGLATVDSDETSSEYNHITYTPNANFHGTDPFTYTASDGEIGSDARVTVTVRSINDAPTFPADTAERSVLVTAAAGDPVGNPVEATDADEDDTLTYSLSGADASSFEIDAEGQITVSSTAILDTATDLTVTVIARDSATPPGTAMVEVTITVRARPVRPPITITGPVAPRGPTPSAEDFEWNVARDIEELDGGNDWPTGLWSDGATLWLAENGPGADDEVYAYDLASGERVEGREFELDATNRAPRGFWSDKKTVWVSDSGRDRLFAYDLESGERLEDREVELPRDNRDPRGIWSDGVNIWVLDGRADALLAYDLASGERLTGYELVSANSDPRGIWSDGGTVWVSDDGAKRLFAYRLPVLRQEEQAADAEAIALVRVRDEEFDRLPRVSNNSPRGIWSDGEVIYVADESDDRVYSYNMPDAIDARLASLALSGVEIGEFDSGLTEYEGVPGDGVTETTVEAEAAQPGATVAIEPADANEATDGHQLALEGVGEITITVTSADESRTKVYQVRFGEAGPSATCLRGAITVGFSLLVYEGGSIEDLAACAQSRHVTALYALSEGVWVSYILGAPEFVNSAFRELYAGGVPSLTPLTARSEGPATADPRRQCRRGSAVAAVPARRHRHRLQPRALRGRECRGPRCLCTEPGRHSRLRAPRRRVRVLHRRSPGLREQRLP